MKNHLMLLSFLLGLGVAVTFTACDDDDDNNVDPEDDNTNVIVSENITEDTTWEKENIYQLGGRISVEEGATLTIEAGTIIKGEAGTGSNATALLVARGAKLMAEGEEDAPIIFTSVADEITPEDVEAGNFGSPNLDPVQDGLWGGVIVLGSAPISASNDDGDISEIQIEGIPTSDPNGLYGGNDEDDNSGVLKYISIRHGGSNIGEGNEINGLTLGGVGNGTVVENIEVVSNQDDGIEWFGGTVNVSNAVVWNCYDDAIDADQMWTGTLDNFMVISPDDHNFELDGPEGSEGETGDFAPYTIKNGIVIANSDNIESSDLINTDDNTGVHFNNIFFTAINEGQIINRVSHDIGDVVFQNIVLDVPEENLADYVVDGNVPEGVTAGSEPANPGAIDTSVFGWTWAHEAGAMNY
ncbi:MAG: hypothetical protein R6U46_11520 [Marinilabilia sp.]